MKHIFSCMLCILSYASYADTSISGNTTVAPGSTETYTVNWSPWDIQNGVYGNITWSVTNGVILFSESNYVMIKWDDVPTYLNSTGSVSIVSDAVWGSEGTLNVDLVNFVEGILESCNEILGPPSVFENFGTGNNPGPPLPVGLTTYIYNPSCGISSGEYTRTNRTVGCRSAWLGLPFDHTPGDINGYMVLIDGDNHAGEVYRKTATGLTAAFRYEFSAWLANLENEYEKPRVHFDIYDMAGNLIQSSGSFGVEYDQLDPWKRKSFMFNLPLGTTSVQIVLVNENNNPLGDDFVIDDISFAPCFPPILASFSNNLIVEKANACDNGTVNLYSSWPLSIIPFTNPGFKWQRSDNAGTSWTDIPGATTMNFTQSETRPGIYQYRIYAYEIGNPSQFILSHVLNYFVHKLVVNSKTYNVFACNNSAVTLDPDFRLFFCDPSVPAPVNYLYNWSPGTYLSSTTVMNPLISLPPLPPPPVNVAPPPPVNYSYTLTVQDANFGCVGSAVQTVSHYNPRKVLVPSAFTPNGDGVNDLFRPLNLQDYPGGKFWVFSRWGQNVFYSIGPTLLNYSWDGTYQGVAQPNGNYIWQVSIPGCPNNILNGGTGTNIPNGNVLLIR